MENLIQLVNRLQRACTALGDQGEDSALPTLWDALPSIADVGGQDEEEMKIQKVVRESYGRFFYRFPNGESAADVHDRITGFRDTLTSDIEIERFQAPGEQSPNMNLIIISHGLTLRVFLMRRYKWTVEQFEGLYNIPSDKIIVMERGHGGRYCLLMHHTKEELKELGFTDAMLIDQEWQKYTKLGEINCRITGPSCFTHFDQDHENGTTR